MSLGSTKLPNKNKIVTKYYSFIILNYINKDMTILQDNKQTTDGEVAPSAVHSLLVFLTKLYMKPIGVLVPAVIKSCNTKNNKTISPMHH